MRNDFLILLIAQTLVTLFIRFTEKSWYAPASLFALIWNFIFVFSILSAQDYYFSVPALLSILLFVTVFFCGGRLALVFKNIKSQTVDAQLLNTGNIVLHELIIKVGVLSGFTALILLLQYSGLTLSSIFNFQSFSEASFKVSAERYAGVRLSSPIMLCITISYITSFVAGMLLAGKTTKSQKIWIALLILPIVLFSVFYTARSVMLYMFVIIGGSYFAFKPFYQRNHPVLFSRRNVIIGAAGIFLLLSAFIISQSFRMKLNLNDSGQFSFVTNYLKVWFSGNVSGYSSWYDVESVLPVDNSGSFTFAGLSELFGVSERKVGIYETTIDVNHQMSFSNIYTAFRFLMDDFGFSGTLIVFALLGFLSKYFFERSRRGSLTSAAILSGILAFFLFSFISSIWAYNSILFSWIGFCCYCFYSESKTVKV